MRLIDAEGSELQTQLKIIREAEYQIYGSGSWGFTAKCEHAIEDAPTVQPEPHWIPVTERLPEPRIDVWCNSDLGQMVGYYDEMIETWFGRDYLELLVNAWMPLPEPYKGVTE